MLKVEAFSSTKISTFDRFIVRNDTEIKGTGMTKIERIESEIRALTDTERAELRKWFFEFDAEIWDKQIERDSISGRLANLAKKSLEDHKGGTSTDL